jgi:hypothetical protein
MKNKLFIKNVIATFIVSISAYLATAQSNDGWYKVFTGKMGNYTAILHLHKSAKNYSGYLWFQQNQWPMQLYYNEPLKKTDSLLLSANSGPMAIVLYGILKGDSFSGMSELSKDNGTPKKANFDLMLNNEQKFTPFNYYYADGFAKLPPQLKNESEFNYTLSAIWPQGNSNTDKVYKNEIRELFGIKTQMPEIGKYLVDEKNKYSSNWKKENSKLTPKQAEELGMSISVQEEMRALVLYENDQFITIAHYNFSNSGGAAGSFGTTLSTFAKKTGMKLKLSDVLNSSGIQYLPKILDQAARVQYSIKNNKPLDQNGFLVNKIEPSQNFYVTETGLGFFYLPRSIKPFSDSEINLFVPFTVLKAYLQPGIAIK